MQRHVFHTIVSSLVMVWLGQKLSYQQNSRVDHLIWISTILKQNNIVWTFLCWRNETSSFADCPFVFCSTQNDNDSWQNQAQHENNNHYGVPDMNVYNEMTIMWQKLCSVYPFWWQIHIEPTYIDQLDEISTWSSYNNSQINISMAFSTHMHILVYMY